MADSLDQVIRDQVFDELIKTSIKLSEAEAKLREVEQQKLAAEMRVDQLEDALVQKFSTLTVTQHAERSIWQWRYQIDSLALILGGPHILHAMIEQFTDAIAKQKGLRREIWSPYGKGRQAGD